MNVGVRDELCAAIWWDEVEYESALRRDRVISAGNVRSPLDAKENGPA